MRENRPYGSEGGEGSTLPDPYQTTVHSCRGDALRRPDATIGSGDRDVRGDVQCRDSLPCSCLLFTGTVAVGCTP